MEPHRQACGTSCYAQTGDILSKERSHPRLKPWCSASKDREAEGLIWGVDEGIPK